MPNDNEVTPSAIGQLPQSQASLNDQLNELQRLAVLNGLYDAADWLRSMRARSRAGTTPLGTFTNSGPVLLTCAKCHVTWPAGSVHHCPTLARFQG